MLSAPLTSRSFTLRNIKEDLEDLGPRFDGAPDLEFRVIGAPNLGARLRAKTSMAPLPRRTTYTSSCFLCVWAVRKAIVGRDALVAQGRFLEREGLGRRARISRPSGPAS